VAPPDKAGLDVADDRRLADEASAVEEVAADEVIDELEVAPVTGS
jgi:hypothetical protein